MQNNLKLLQARNPALAEHVVRGKDPHGVLVVNSQSGRPTLLTTDRQGNPKFLHSPKDPVQEARRLLDGYAFKNEDGTILFGFGLGYLVKEIVKKKAPNHVLCILEGSAEMLKLAMTHMDLSDILSNKNIHVFTADFPSEMTEHFQAMQAKAVTGRIHKLSIPLLRNLFSETYAQIDEQLEKHIRSLQFNFRTFNATRERRIDNLFKNIPFLWDSLPIDRIANTLKGQPAFVIAAGPSLAENLDVLKQKNQDIFIIAVDTALKPLVENGIIPDLAVTCESHSGKIKAFEGIPGNMLTKIPLAFSPTSNPRVVKKFGKKFIVNIEDSLAGWFVDKDRKVATFSDIQTVSKMGFMAARLMGADPIVFVGLDLAFPTDQEHAEGCRSPWKIDFQKHNFVHVPDNNGGKVKTIEGFVSMIYSLGGEIRRAQVRCINVSRYGAYVEGSEWMPLSEVFIQCNRNANAHRHALIPSILEEAAGHGSRHLKQRYLDAISWIVKQTDALMEICCEVSNSDIPLESEGTSLELDMDSITVLTKAYQSAFAYTDFLDILTDYLPRYMVRCSMSSHTNGPDPVRFVFFFQELKEFLPGLKARCREALSRLQGA